MDPIVIEEAAAHEAIGRILHHFRKLPGHGDGREAQDKSAEARRGRGRVFALLEEIATACHLAGIELDWARLRPEADERFAEPKLREVLALTLQLFGLLPGTCGQFPAQPQPKPETPTDAKPQ